MKDKRTHALAASAITVLIGVGLFYQVSYWASRGGQGVPLFSVRRYDPYGTAALSELLAQRGLQVKTLERSRPERSDRGVLIQVLGPAGPSGWLDEAPRLQTQKLKQWMTLGHTVIQFTARRTELMDACGVPQAPTTQDHDLWAAIQKQMIQGVAPDVLDGRLVRARWLGSRSDGTTPARRPIELLEPMPLPDESTRLWQPLATAARRTVVAAQRVGAGRLIVVASPWPALNGGLADGGNLAMVLELVGDGPVLIDEWSHGIGNAGTVVGVIKSLGLAPLVVQILFVVGLYTWSTLGHRRSEPDRSVRKRSSVEQIVSLGYLYDRSMSTGQILARTRQEIAQRLSAALRCRPQQIERKLRSMKPTPAVQNAIALYDSIPPTVPDQEPACRRCGYSLRGSQGEQCPECGAAVDPQQDRQRSAQASPVGAGPAPTQGNPAQLLTRSHELARELHRERKQRSATHPTAAG